MCCAGLFGLLLLLWCCQVSEADLDKKGDGYVLKSDPSIKVHARAHKVSQLASWVASPLNLLWSQAQVCWHVLRCRKSSSSRSR